MKLILLNGGGPRVPLMLCTPLIDQSERQITELGLQDTDTERLTTIHFILRTMAQGHPRTPEVRMMQNLGETMAGTGFVFNTIRIGSTEDHATGETITYCCGVFGQETTDFGGLDYVLRGVPTAVRIIKIITRLAPGAHLVNFTNPAETTTEVSSRILGDRAIGTCDPLADLAR